MPHELARKSMELLAREVLPHVRNGMPRPEMAAQGQDSGCQVGANTKQ
jgi:hypothetical protein